MRPWSKPPDVSLRVSVFLLSSMVSTAHAQFIVDEPIQTIDIDAPEELGAGTGVASARYQVTIRGERRIPGDYRKIVYARLVMPCGDEQIEIPADLGAIFRVPPGKQDHAETFDLDPLFFIQSAINEYGESRSQEEASKSASPEMKAILTQRTNVLYERLGKLRGCLHSGFPGGSRITIGVRLVRPDRSPIGDVPILVPPTGPVEKTIVVASGKRK